ncbi:MAG: type II toxin-antitoxin system HicA family toxin [Phycisphaerae bacterium]
MGDRVRRMTAREVEALLGRHGFELVSQKGSHRKWRNGARGLQVIVPQHRGRPLPLGTLRNILKGAEIPESEWKA